jgi:hypothetical protein
MVFHVVVHEGALLAATTAATLFCRLQRYCPNIAIIWDGRIHLFALSFTSYFVYKVYIDFLSGVRDWTVAVAQYSKFVCYLENDKEWP